MYSIRHVPDAFATSDPTILVLTVTAQKFSSSVIVTVPAVYILMYSTVQYSRLLHIGGELAVL